MKKIYFFAVLSLFSTFTYAKCKVPDSLEGLTFQNMIDPHYSSINPNAGAIERITYHTDIYKARFINDRTIGPFKGLYTYRVLDEDNGVGLYQGYESKPFNKPSHTVVFKCLTNNYGLAIFTQQSGENEEKSRQNSIFYTITRR
ncbi:hypothetical protein [Photobacterium leiognathi]|uniref:hypothetical protein n=1 Tax=Photobacterium leiognathi TaxID=553611 RepID=UPI0027329061|nr:hypothetical protein [Photobacterium leiognathi]